MVDEVDSVLIDDARTPLIISGPIGKQDNIEQFFELKPELKNWVEAQKSHQSILKWSQKKLLKATMILKMADWLYSGHTEDYQKLCINQMLSEPNAVKLQKSENYYLADQQREMPKADEELFFLHRRKNSVELTDKGIRLITKAEDQNFFVLPVISNTCTGR